MRSSYIVAAILAATYMVVTVLATAGFSTPAAAGMRQDLASCTAAEGRGSAAACTRVMNSGRLREEQVYIGYFNRGSSYKRAGDLEKARADFTRVVKLNPKFARGYHMRALVHDELGATDKALADLKRAITLKPKAWHPYLSRAAILRTKKDYDDALADLRRAGDLAPKEQKLRLYRALVMSDMGRKAAARAEINKVIAEGGTSPAAYYVRAAVAFQERRSDAASADLDRALNKRSTFAAAHMLKGRIAEARGDTPAAKASYRKALAAPTGGIDGRLAHKTARKRLDALGGSKSPNVALVEPNREVGCRRFLPATGTIITAECND